MIVGPFGCGSLLASRNRFALHALFVLHRIEVRHATRMSPGPTRSAEVRPVSNAGTGRAGRPGKPSRRPRSDGDGPRIGGGAPFGDHGATRRAWTAWDGRPGDLWIAAFAVGGNLSLPEVVEIATGARQTSGAEHDLLVAAINHRFIELDPDHRLACWNDLSRPPGP